MTLESIEKLLSDDASLAILEKRLLSCTGHSFIGDALNAIAEDIEAEIAERYMELPVDADGVPIRIGDSLECMEYGNQTERFTVHGYTTEYSTWTGDVAPLMATDENSTEFYCRNCRHVNPRTVEDVLREFAYKVCDLNVADCDVERYAAELRELLEVGDER